MSWTTTTGLVSSWSDVTSAGSSWSDANTFSGSWNTQRVSGLYDTGMPYDEEDSYDGVEIDWTDVVRNSSTWQTIL